MNKFKVGDKVEHDFSLTYGEIKAVKRLGKYRYFVYWPSANTADWYEGKVLKKLGGFVMAKKCKVHNPMNLYDKDGNVVYTGCADCLEEL
jgi:hypothetical protein